MLWSNSRKGSGRDGCLSLLTVCIYPQAGILTTKFNTMNKISNNHKTVNESRNPRLKVGAVIARFSLFSTGFIQVYFVAVNTYFIANEMYLGVLIAAFMISLIWSFNVKKVAFGSTTDRVAYALGATCGSLVGLWSSSFIASVLNGL